MIKKSLLLMAFFLALFGAARATEVEIGVGSGTTTNTYLPGYNYYNYSWTQQIYTAAEIGMDGTINSVAFYNAGAEKTRTYKVYMSMTDKETFSGGTDWVAMSDGDLVFTGELTFAVGVWTTIDLDTPFDYDGRSNLLIGVADVTGSYSSSPHMACYVFDATSQAIRAYRDASAYDIAAPGVTGTVLNVKNQIILDITASGGGPTCDKPSTFEVFDITGYGASFKWTSDVGQFVFEYKEASEERWEEIEIESDTTYILTNLQPTTAYNARVKAVCGTDNESGYKTVNFTTKEVCPDGKVCIGEGTSTNSYLPTYTFYNYSLTQQIYTAEEIGQEGLISSVDFYKSSTYEATRDLDIYMVATDKATFSSSSDWIAVTAANLVYSGEVTFDNNTWTTIEFDNYFIYDGRSNVALIVDDNSGSYSTAPSFYVFTATSQAIRIYSDDTNYDPEAPSSYSGAVLSVKNRVRFGIEDVPSCWKPSALTVSDVTARSVQLSWDENGTATSWQICLNGNESNPVNVTTNPYPLTGLTPETAYTVKVRANCGTDGYSDWSAEKSFTTDEACHTPYNFYADTITAYSALVTWSCVDTTTFNLRYAALPATRGTASNPRKFTDFITMAKDHHNVQITAAPNVQPNTNSRGDQLRDGWYYYDDGTYYSSFGASGSMFWATMFPTGTFTENMLTKIALYEAEGNNENPITVYVCEGNNAPDNILYIEEFQTEAADDFHEVTLADPVIFDPSKNLWLVFYATDNYPAAVCDYSGTVANNRWCSFDGSVWYDLADVGGDEAYGWMIRAYVKTVDLNSLTWTNVNVNSEFEYNITGLTPETSYIAQVRANCGGQDGESHWASTVFTTLPSCMVPTDLMVYDSTITAHTATLKWTETGEATAWQFCLNDDETNLIDANTNPFTITGLDEQTTYSVKVRANCGGGDVSHWSWTTSFTTDIACYAPTGLTPTNIQPHSANFSWNSEAESFDLKYAQTDGNWLTYDNGTCVTTIGSSSPSTRTWAVRYPSEMLGRDNVLSMISIYEADCIESNITVKIFQGGDTVPERLLYTEVVTPLPVSYGFEGFHLVELAEPVSIDPDQSLWIALTATGPYVMPACESTLADNRWVYVQSENEWKWQQLSSSLSNYGWMIRGYLGDVNWTTANDVTELSYTISNLESETHYTLRVRSNCGIDGYSWWETTTFTTPDACDAPINVMAIDSLTTAYTATLNWMGYQDSYNLRYAYREGDPETNFTANFEDGAIPATMTNDANYPWTVVTDTIHGSYYMKSGNGGVSSSTSSISITITYPADGFISFDLWSRGEGSDTYDWDKSQFLIDGSMKMNYGAHSAWESFNTEVTAGQHTFTWKYKKDGSANPTGDYFAVDNIVMGTKTYDWERPVEGITEIPYTLTGLERTTDYFVQVQGVCNNGLTEWSDIATFTTTVSCWTPSNLKVEDVMPDQAVISWKSNGEEDGWDIEVADSRDTIIVPADSNPFTLTRLNEDTYYKVRVRANCGDEDGVSEWSSYVNFTTPLFCEVPDDLTVVDSLMTYSSAVVKWDGLQDSYNLRYYALEAFLTENFESQAIPTSWTNTSTPDSLVWKVVTDSIHNSYYMKSGNAGVGSSTSSVTCTATFSNAGYISFDAECRGEGTSTAWDKCIFEIDSVAKFTYGAQLTDMGWLHYAFPVTAGNHTFTWKYTKDSSVNNPGDYFAVDNISMSINGSYQPVNNIAATTYEITGLTQNTEYFVQVQGICDSVTEWTDAINFTTTGLPTQTIELTAGSNYVSYNVEITLAQLKAALVEAYPNSAITIKSKTQTHSYNPNNHRWTGSFNTFNVANMNIIKVAEDGEITLQGLPIDPAEHPITITQGQSTYISFPLTEEMTPTAAFAGFAAQGDKIKSKAATCAYNRNRWGNQIPTLEPGKGYIYQGGANTGTRTLVFPSSSK